MSENESAWAESRHPEPLPLRKGQRFAATSVGLALTGAGGVAVFVGSNQAGSVALLLAGTLFLLVALTGMPVMGAKLKDFELSLAWRWQQTIREVADRLPLEEGRRLLREMDVLSPGAYTEPLVQLIDFLLLLGRVRDAVIVARADGDHLEVRRTLDTGDPLIEWLPARRDLRIGVFAMFAPSEPGTISEAFSDEFVRRLTSTGCDAVILVTCVRDKGDLAKLAIRVREEVGLPSTIEEWGSDGKDRPLRPTIDRLVRSVKGQ